MPDAERPDLEQFEWSPERRSESLAGVFAHAVGLASDAERWYARARRTNRRWAQTLRIGAIVLGGLAAILPILSEIYTSGGKPTISPGWAAVAIAAAATLIALDRFFGFSAGWMRFMAAELRITRLRHEFQYAWEALRAAAGTPPGEDHVSALITRARDFVLAIDDAVADETSGWVIQFKANLETTEQSLERSRHA